MKAETKAEVGSGNSERPSPANREQKVARIAARQVELTDSMGLRCQPGMFVRFLNNQPEAELDRWAGLLGAIDEARALGIGGVA